MKEKEIEGVQVEKEEEKILFANDVTLFVRLKKFYQRTTKMYTSIAQCSKIQSKLTKIQ